MSNQLGNPELVEQIMENLNTSTSHLPIDETLLINNISDFSGGINDNLVNIRHENFGRINFNVPVFNPNYIEYMRRLLHCINRPMGSDILNFEDIKHKNFKKEFNEINFIKLEELIGDKQLDSCPICLIDIAEENDQNMYIILNCHHVFHSKCLNDYVNKHNGNKCPMCRSNI